MNKLKEISERGADVHGNISKLLYREILSKLRYLNDRPEFYAKRTGLVEKDLNSLGNVHSWHIENPGCRAAWNTENKSPEELKKATEEGIFAVNRAWDFVKKINCEDFVKNLNASTLIAVNSLVIGNGEYEGSYRSGDVFLGFKNYVAPSSIRVPDLVDDILTQTKTIYLSNPLEAAIYNHLHLALTQPFEEGNKRTARLIQNGILHSAGLPPAIISASEGQFYRGLLDGVAEAYLKRDVAGQRPFYDYMASQFNKGLDKILDDLKNSQIFFGDDD